MNPETGLNHRDSRHSFTKLNTLYTSLVVFSVIFIDKLSSSWLVQPSQAELSLALSSANTDPILSKLGPTLRIGYLGHMYELIIDNCLVKFVPATFISLSGQWNISANI